MRYGALRNCVSSAQLRLSLERQFKPFNKSKSYHLSYTKEELTMGRALIIGCGGVAGVVIHKCCQNSDVFEEIMIASRTKSKCDAIKEKLDGTTATKIRTAKVDADNVDELCALIDEYKPDIVMNIALPYQDLTIMDACLKCGVTYRKLRAGGHRRSGVARHLREALQGRGLYRVL